MKIVLDTNVLVSAILTPGRAQRVVLFIADHPEMRWLVSPEILKEYEAILARKKFELPPWIQAMWLELIRAKCDLVSPTVSRVLERDPSDAKFVSCAVEGKADYLITGDRDFNDIVEMEGVRIISIAMFDELIVGPLIGG